MNLKSIFSSLSQAVLGTLAPIPTKKMSKAEEALEWLSQELGLDKDTIKKSLLRPGQNDWTIDPSDIALGLLRDAQDVLQAERHLVAATKSTGFTAFSIPFAVAFTASPAAAWLTGMFFSGPLISVAVQLTDKLEENKKAALRQYASETSRLRELFRSKAEEFEHRHGNCASSINVEMAGDLEVPERPINDLYVRPKTQIAAEKFVRWMMP